MAWGNIISDAASPSTYGSTAGFNDANSGSGVDWAGLSKAFGSDDKTDQPPAPPPTLQSQRVNIPGAPVGRPSPLNIRELLTLLAQRQQMYQQAATGPAVKGGLPQEPPRPLGLLGI